MEIEPSAPRRFLVAKRPPRKTNSALAPLSTIKIPKKALVCVLSHGVCEIGIEEKHADNSKRHLIASTYTVPENMNITRYSLPFGTDFVFRNKSVRKKSRSGKRLGKKIPLKTTSEELYELIKENGRKMLTDGNITPVTDYIKSHVELLKTDPYHKFGVIKSKEILEESIGKLNAHKAEVEKHKHKKTHKIRRSRIQEEHLGKIKKMLSEDEYLLSNITDFTHNAVNAFSFPKKFGPGSQIMNKSFFVPLDRVKYREMIFMLDSNGIEYPIFPRVDGEYEIFGGTLSEILDYLKEKGYDDIMILDFSCSGADDKEKLLSHTEVRRTVKRRKSQLSSFGGDN